MWNDTWVGHRQNLAYLEVSRRKHGSKRFLEESTGPIVPAHMPQSTLAQGPLVELLASRSTQKHRFHLEATTKPNTNDAVDETRQQLFFFFFF